MSDLRGYARAQAQYDAMTPPDDGPYECPDCNGRGSFVGIGDIPEEGDYTECAECNGFGWIGENGEPFDKDAAERDADEAADMKREDY
jgi:hypothetical protein